MYRVMVVKGSVRRILDLTLDEMQIVAQDAAKAGWQVTSVILPRGAELLPGILEETTDQQMN